METKYSINITSDENGFSVNAASYTIVEGVKKTSKTLIQRVNGTLDDVFVLIKEWKDNG